MKHIRTGFLLLCFSLSLNYSILAGDSLNRIIFKDIDFDAIPVLTVLNYIHQKSQDADPQQKGINFVIALKPGEIKGLTNITTKAEQLPAGDFLKYVCKGAKLQYQITPYSLIVRKKPAEKPQPRLPARINESRQSKVSGKLGRLRLKGFNQENISPAQAVKLMKQAAKEVDPQGKGINLFQRKSQNPYRLTILSREIPFEELLRVICLAVDLEYVVDQYAVTVQTARKPVLQRKKR